LRDGMDRLSLHNKGKQAVRIKFEGQTHCIDANTLINVLTHYQTVVAEANRQLGCGGREISVKINAIEKGSFIIDFTLAQNIVEQLFNDKSVEYLASLTTIIGGVYGLYRTLRGKPTKNATGQEVSAIRNLSVNGDGNNFSIIQNVYNSPLIREAISKSIETSDADPSVEGLSMQDDKGNEYANFSRGDFKTFIYDDFDKEDDIPDEKFIEEDATLVIVGLNFEKSSRWTFVYRGMKIPIIVKDDALMQQIDHGARFGKGDAIKVRLRIVQRYDKSCEAYINRSYKIVEFHELVTRKEPLDMFSGD